MNLWRTAFDYINVVKMITDIQANGLFDCQIVYMKKKKEWIVKSSYWIAKSESNQKILIQVQP